VEETGSRGEGGDRTLEIDEAAETAVFNELEALHADGARFTAVSEERGWVDFGDPGVLVVIDPIDGSVNAKRGLPHHALSIAVAHGDTMADVVFGFVQDFGPDEEWVAWRGRGASVNGLELDPTLGERRTRHGKLELVGFESAEPRWMRESAEALAEAAGRVRAIGAIAVSLCQVAAARFDGMVAEGLPRRGRRRGPADRPRGRRRGRVHGLRRPARRPAGPRAALPRGRRAHRGRIERARARAILGACPL
jgi:myo-inositol-1(or 4)-monophosphatase